MLVVRPAGPADLDFLLELAILSGPGFTSLPEDPDQLAERLDLSRDSFAGQIEPRHRWYTLMLEETETGDVDGIVPFTGTRAWLTKGLAWPAATALHAWPAPDGQTGGWAYSFSHPTSGGKLMFASIRNAGHMTQATQQARALAMFRAYLAGKEL